jgi:hypothetical protein
MVATAVLFEIQNQLFFGVNPGSMPGQGLSAVLGILAKAGEM